MSEQDSRLGELKTHLQSVIAQIEGGELDFDAAQFAIERSFDLCKGRDYSKLHVSLAFNLTYDFGVSNLLREHFKGCEFKNALFSGEKSGRFVWVKSEKRMDFRSIRDELKKIGQIPDAQWIEAIFTERSHENSVLYGIADPAFFIEGDESYKYFPCISKGGFLTMGSCSKSRGHTWYWLVQVENDCS